MNKLAMAVMATLVVALAGFAVADFIVNAGEDGVVYGTTGDDSTEEILQDSSEVASVQIGDTISYYASLEAAVEAALNDSGSGATITLLKNDTTSSPLCFTKSGNYVLIINQGVTLTHKTGGYLLTVGGSNPPKYPSDTQNPQAILTIKGEGSIVAESGTVFRSYGQLIYGEDGVAPSVTYRSSSSNHTIFKVEENSSLIVNAGKFALGPDPNEVTRIVQSWGNTTINGGEFQGFVEYWTCDDYKSSTIVKAGTFTYLWMIYYSGGSGYSICKITNPQGVSLGSEVKDSKIGYTMSFKENNSDSNVTIYRDIPMLSPIEISKRVTISGGSISASDSFSGEELISISSSGELTLNSCTVNAKNKCYAITCNGGKLNLGDGTMITGGDAGKVSAKKQYHGGVFMTGKSTFTMSGGEISGNVVGTDYANDRYLQYSADLWIGSEAVGTITGGIVKNVFVNSNPSKSPNAYLELNGGTLDNVFVEWDGSTNIGEFRFTSGTVSNLILATNSDWKNHTTRTVDSPQPGTTYQVSAGASIGDVSYETLALAVSAAGNEATIKILANTDCVFNQNKTLNFETDGITLSHPQVKNGQDKEATCTEEGLKAGSSCACGKETKSSEVIPKKDHTPQTVSGRDATCTLSGYESYVRCSVCNTILSGGATIPATGHSWDSGTVTKEATETSEGVKTYKCTNCSATKTETIPKLTCTHTWDSGTVTQEATCGTAGSKTLTCTKCGETKTESIAATGNHSWDSGTVVKEPTTTESGTTEYKCTVCGQTKTATIEPKKTEVEEKDGVKTTTDTTKTVEKADDGSETVTETTTVSKEENGKVVEKVETTKSTTEKDGTTIVSESTVTEKDGQTEKVETTKSTTQTEDTTTVAESTVKEKNGQLVEKVETITSTTQTEDSTIVSETKVTEKAGEETEKVETVTSTTQKEGATIVAETKVTEKGQEKTETIAVSIGSDDGSVKTDVSVSDGTTSGIETVISGDVTDDTIAHAIKQADMATEAISDKVSDVSKNISVPSDNVTLSPTSLGALADSGASLTITGDAGSIGIDAKVTGTMMSRNEDVTISINEKKTGLTEEQKQKAGENKVIELSARSATEDIHELGGTAKVRIDMTGMDFKSPAVYWLKDDGSSERVDAEFGEGYAAIELNHFSLYYIAETAQESENSTVVYVAIAVVIIAILAIAGVVMYKRKTA